MRFEKWQALGNDYLIVEAKDLPWALSPGRIRTLCDPHFGPGGDGVLELSPPASPGFVARLRIFNPDGSEAELSGNGAREAIMYLRRSGWTDADTFSIETAAGEIRPTITGETTCRVDMGRAHLTSKDFPGGPDDGLGTVESGGRTWRFQHVSIGNPQCAIRLESREELESLDLAAIGPAIQNDDQFPNRTNTSFWCEISPTSIRARIFERDRRVRGGGGPRPARRRLAGHRAARRRRAGGRRRRVAARGPHGLGRADLPGGAEPGAAR
jgi:diaminopimelate epimerase